MVKGNVICVEKLGFAYPFRWSWGYVPLACIGFLDGLGFPFIFMGGGFLLVMRCVCFTSVLIVIIGV